MAQDIAMSPFGYCGNDVTGGGNATPTLVSTLEQFKAETTKPTTPKVIIITHDIEFNSLYTIQDTQNLTILALPGVKLFSNEQNKDYSGILYFKRCSNIILRNITFEGPGAYDCDGNDCLCFQDVTNSWVDHCDFQDGCDGNFDNKNGTDNVTVSWCRFRYLKEPKAGGSGGSNDHRYTNLLGSSSTDKPNDGTYNMTWAYCWWDEGCKERMLRCRNASLHFLGCYWNSSVANYYIGPENADAYIELCTFEGKPATDHIFYQNYGGTNGATFVNSVATKGLPSNVSNRTVLVPSYSAPKYSSAAAAKEAVKEYAGATLNVDEQGNVSGTNIAANTPVISKNLEASTTAYVGIEKTLSITASYADSYQWYRNTTASNSGGTAISGATSSSYTFTPSAAGTYYYYCVATNSQATGTKSVASAVCTVTVNAAPTMWTAATAQYNSTSKGYEVAGVGTYYKSTSGGTTTLDNQDTSADWAAGKNYVVTSSSLFIFSPQVTVSGLKLYVKGTGSRTMSSVKVASSLSDSYNDLSYDAISTCSNSRYVATSSERSIITLTFNSTVDANKFIQITLSGNVNVYGIEPIASQAPSIPDPTSVIVSPASKTIAVGETLELSAQILPTDADQSLAWSSEKPSIAEVDEDGVVTARAIGTVKITATTANGKSDYCILTVVAKQTGGTSGDAIVWDFTQMSAQTFTEGETYTFTANDGSTLMTYKAGSNDKIEGTPSYLRENGTTNSAGSRGISLNVQGQGTLSIYCKDTNKGIYECYNGSASGTKLADYTAYIGNEDPVYTSTINVTEANGLFIKTTTKGYIYKIIWTPTTVPTTQTITKHISSAEWASFVPSENVKVPESVTVYYAKAGTYNGSSVVAVPVAAGETIAKNTGFFVNGSEGNHEFVVSDSSPLTITDNMLSCGTNATITNGSLVFGRNYINSVLTTGFFPLTSYDIQLPEGIVYIDAAKLNGGGQAKAISVVFDEATIIKPLENVEFRIQNHYNLSGQKVDSNYKGIVIINGRKVWKR